MDQKKTRFPIGAKFILVILCALSVTVAAIVLNATAMFRRDNLNNIYLSSDLLTAAKAGETHAWLDAAMKKGIVVGSALMAGKGADPGRLLDRFRKDQDILFVNVFEAGKPAHPAFALGRSWLNRDMAEELGLADDQFSSFRSGIKIRFDKVSAGGLDIRSEALPAGQPILILNVPYGESRRGRFSAALSIGVRQDRLLASFADTGPYVLALVDPDGRILAHPDPTRVMQGETLQAVPIVKRMIASNLEREFQEFTLDKVRYLGAFAKVGFAGLGVVSQVPRSVAFETGDVLVRRSILLSLIVLSAVFVFAYLFVQTIVSPVRQLRVAAQEISRGNFDVRVAVRTRDEMLDLASSFNAMGSEIARKIQNLSRINEASRTIASTLEPSKLMEYSAETLRSLLHSKRVWASFQGSKDKAPVDVRKDWFHDRQIPMEKIAEKARKAEQPFRDEVAGVPVLVAPIREKSEVAGYAVLAEKETGKGFQDEDIFMAGTLMSSVGTTIENIHLLQETADKARMEKELETAKHVQDTMFPPQAIEIGKLEVMSYYEPASECGGDWWGCVELPGDKVLLAIGDATGHGVPAAMVTATAKSACSVMHGLCKSSPSLAGSPRVMLHLLNKAVYESTQGKILMTFFVAVVDLKTREVTYATASHDPIYWYKMPKGTEAAQPGSKENLSILEVEPGPRLGQQAEAYYQQATAKLGKGDFILLYTDGLPEGKNPSGEEYEERKFLRSIAKHAHKPSAETRDGILADFRSFIEGEKLHDDITIAVARFKS